MAENSVPLGQAGTGAAVILGDDRASQNFNRAFNQRQAILRDEERKVAEAMAQSYRKNMLAASDGKLFAQQLGDLEQKHIKQGMDYRSQGFDIYNPNPNDPKQLAASEQYMSDRRMIENLRNYRSGIEKQFNTVNAALSKANAGEYNQSDIDAMHKFINGTDLLEAYNSNTQLPNVRKNFNVEDALKGVRATPESSKRIENGMVVDTTVIDPKKAESTVVSSILNADGGQEYLMEVTGGVPLNEVRSLPNSRDEIRKQRERDYNGIPQLRQYLAGQQIQKGNANYDKWLNEETDRLYNAKKGYDELISNGVNRISAGVPLKDNRMPDYQGRNYNLAVQREQRLQNQQNTKGDNSEKPKDLYYTNDFIDRVFAGARGEPVGQGSGEELGGILEGKGYSTSWKLNNNENAKTQTKPYHVEKFVSKDGKPTGKLKITLAPRTIVYKNSSGDDVIRDFPSRSITIDAKNENVDRSKLNSFLKEATSGSLGLKESQVRTNQPSGMIKGGQNTQTNKPSSPPRTTISRSELASRASASGYSVAEYEKLLKQKGIKIQ